MTYLNNAATTFPKPQSVINAMIAALRLPPSNQFRSESGGTDVLQQCRDVLGRLFSIADTDRIFFTSGATDALNRLIFGLDLSETPVVITPTEHNSVLRPLFNNAQTRDKISVLPCNSSGLVEPKSFPRGALVIVNHCSNVTGCIQNLPELCRKTHEAGGLILVDASQSAGCLPIDVDGWGIDMLAFTGHKSLFGAQGTGGFYVRRGITLRPLLYGGTGKDSARLRYDDENYEYEVGTQNAVGIASLCAGAEYVLQRGVDVIAETEQRRILMLRNRLAELPNVIVYGDEQLCRGPLLSFNIQGFSPADAGYILQNVYDITLRTGLHCSPIMHEQLGTMPQGTIRVSISDLTTDADLDQFLAAVAELSQSKNQTI